MRIINEGIYAFDKEGILVIIDPTKMGDVIPRQLPLEWHSDMWGGEIKPLRLVINLEFVNRYNPEEPLQEFDPAIQFQVYYTAYERAAAGMKQRSESPLAYWRKNQWKLIPEVEDVYPVLCCGWAGFLRFEINTWGDPTIALIE